MATTFRWKGLQSFCLKFKCSQILLIMIIMYIYHALISALSTHTTHINLNSIIYTHVEHSPTKTIYIRYYMETHALTHTHNDYS